MTQAKYYDLDSGTWKAIIAGPIGPTGPTGATGPTGPQGADAGQIQTTFVDARTFTTTSTSFVDITGLTVDITPQNASSKILVLVSLAWGASSLGFFRILRSGAVLTGGAGGAGDEFTEWANPSGGDGVSMVSWHSIDQPNSLSAQTYKVQCRVNSGTGRLNRRVSSDFYMGTSKITVFEVLP